MSPITTHILDTSRGRPAADVSVTLQRAGPMSTWQTIGQGRTDQDGRMRELLPDDYHLVPGVYRLIFDVATYFRLSNRETFYPSVKIEFAIIDAAQHYHVPLLISPFSYSTYRGS